MYSLQATNRFKKDLKTSIKRGYDVGLLNNVVTQLIAGKPLAEKHSDHSLWQLQRVSRMPHHP